MPIALPEWMVAVLTIATIILGSGRLTRVLVHDTFPPAVWLRLKWDQLTENRGVWGSQWNTLLHCWWCASFWVTLICIGWLISGWYITWLMWAWWVFWGALAASYVATMIIVRDEPEE